MKKLLLITTILLATVAAQATTPINAPALNFMAISNNIGITKIANGWEIKVAGVTKAYTGASAIPDANAAAKAAVDNIIK